MLRVLPYLLSPVLFHRWAVKRKSMSYTVQAVKAREALGLVTLGL